MHRYSPTKQKREREDEEAGEGQADVYSQTARQTVSKLVFYAQSASTVISGRTETDRLKDTDRQTDRQTDREGRRERGSEQATERASEQARETDRQTDRDRESWTTAVKRLISEVALHQALAHNIPTKNKLTKQRIISHLMS